MVRLLDLSEVFLAEDINISVLAIACGGTIPRFHGKNYFTAGK